MHLTTFGNMTHPKVFGVHFFISQNGFLSWSSKHTKKKTKECPTPYEERSGPFLFKFPSIYNNFLGLSSALQVLFLITWRTISILNYIDLNMMNCISQSSETFVNLTFENTNSNIDRNIQHQS